MKFYVGSKNNLVPRLGVLTDVKDKPKVAISTPNVMMHTQGCQIPHITHEVLKLITTDPHILQIPAASIHTFRETLQYYNGNITSFVGSKDSLSCITLQDPTNVMRQGHSGSLKVPIFTRNGKFYYDPRIYMDLIESCKPDMYFLLSDGDTNIASPEKRVSKAVVNTISFYKDCLERHRSSEVLKNSFVMAAIAGGYKLSAREKMINTILQDCKDVDGFLIDGLFNNGAETELVKFNEIEPVVKRVIEKMPVDKLRCVQGCWNPVTILKLVELGVDIFDTTYCHILTERSAAMTFSLDFLDDSAIPEINLRDAQYFEDFRPLLLNCQCLSCRKYSRAYIHHLITVHELLGPILIMIHNLHHYMEFFRKIRESIEENTLGALQASISEQFKSITDGVVQN